MCGLVGIVLGRLVKRRVTAIDALTDLFTKLLLRSQHRGPYATGVAWVKQDGAIQVAKAPLPARTFVQSALYMNWLLGVDRPITYLMGHTRWPSRGSIRNPDNNHPIALPVGAGQALALTHNGTLTAVQRHFERLGLPRTAHVDSELLARIAQRSTDEHGIDVAAFLHSLTPLDGSMSLALVATTRPEEIVMLKGNMPLEVWMHPRSRVLVYASETRILTQSIGSQAGWEPVPLATGEALVINAHTWVLQRRPFTFQGLTSEVTGAHTGASR